MLEHHISSCSCQKKCISTKKCPKYDIYWYRNDRQKLRNPFPASKTHFIFQLKTRTFVRPNVRRNERTNAHTHTLVTVMPLSWCLACGGTWGLALRGKLYGLLAYFTLILFFFTKTNMKLVNGLLLTVLVAEVSSPTHTTHTHPPHACTQYIPSPAPQ